MARKADTPCTICGELTWTGSGSQAPDLRICRPCRKIRRAGRAVQHARETRRPCLSCQTEVVAPRKRCAPCAEIRVAEQYAEKCRRRRVLKRGGSAEPYTLIEIARRDRNRCQLCRRKVDLTVQWPDPKSPSIDHVIPVSEGGDDTKTNVQLAHFGCNSGKGARGSQQLALVG